MGAPSGESRARQRLLAAAWVFAGLLVILVFGRTFVADLFRVKSGSMEPTIFGGDESGETVLVRFDRSPDLERFDLVVVERPGQPDPVVKRVVGLPGETISIATGDLIVDGERLPWAAPRPAWVEVFDGTRTPLEEAFFFRGDAGEPWSRVEGGEPSAGGAASPADDVWEVDATEVARGSNAGMMLFSPDLRDVYTDPLGERRGGVHQVGDGVLELDLSASGEGRVRMVLVEEGDTFDAVLDWSADGGTRLSFERWVADRPAEVVAEVPLDLAPDTWHRMRYRNVDNALVVEQRDVDGAWRTLLAHAYASNQVYGGQVSAGDRSVGARVGFGAEGCRARFRRVHIARDLHFTSQGTYAVGRPLNLGLDEYFLLGDNSADSRDGRFWGPVPAGGILGRPVAVVRPWARRRWLPGPLAGATPTVEPNRTRE